MHYVYELKSLSHDHYYTGCTNNIESRINEHNSGLSKYTKSTKPFELIHYEKFESRSKAIKREKYLKTGKGREELKLILDKNI